jgi:hypothetical protein
MPDPKDKTQIDEAELRDEPEFFQRIGPEDQTAEEKMDDMEAYGYDNMDAGNFESGASTQADQPDWLSREARERNPMTEDNGDDVDVVDADPLA